MVKTMEVDESYPPTMPVDDVAAFLARKKALAARDLLSDKREVLLTADSVVILKDTIYGKPSDAEDARHILKQLSGRMHRVITGVCLLGRGKEKVFSSVSNVYMEELSDAEIKYYIDTFQPFDKAGAYAIQEWIGLCKISKIEGTYSNIMGLPVEQVYRELLEF